MSQDAQQELPQLLEVHISTPDPESAQRIASDLVARQLAVCVQVLGPIASVYAWKGEVQRAQEYLLLAKTTAESFPGLAEVVRHHHRYDIPEVIAIPISHALAEYGNWVRAHSVGSQPPAPTDGE